MALSASSPGVDRRIGELLASACGADTVAEIMGFPTDEGVRRNGGRVGAALGPVAFRRAFGKMTPDPRRPDHADWLKRVADTGDAGAFGPLETRQQQLSVRVSEALRAGRVPVVIGGGHETAYGHFLGYVRAARDVSIVNFDAHPDVRPLRNNQGHSGSPFRQAAEHPAGRLTSYRVFGLQPCRVAEAHLRYLEDRGMSAVFRSQTDEDTLVGAVSDSPGDVLLTVDLDVVDQAAAPGVSAPSVNGVNPSAVLAAVEAAGRNPLVRSMDVVELNPRFDVDHRTARLAAHIVWSFLRGLLDRSPSS